MRDDIFRQIGMVDFEVSVDYSDCDASSPRLFPGIENVYGGIGIDADCFGKSILGIREIPLIREIGFIVGIEMCAIGITAHTLGSVVAATTGGE